MAQRSAWKGVVAVRDCVAECRVKGVAERKKHGGEWVLARRAGAEVHAEERITCMDVGV